MRTPASMAPAGNPSDLKNLLRSSAFGSNSFPRTACQWNNRSLALPRTSADTKCVPIEIVPSRQIAFPFTASSSTKTSAYEFGSTFQSSSCSRSTNFDHKTQSVPIEIVPSRQIAFPFLASSAAKNSGPEFGSTYQSSSCSSQLSIDDHVSMAVNFLGLDKTATSVSTSVPPLHDHKSTFVSMKRNTFEPDEDSFSSHDLSDSDFLPLPPSPVYVQPMKKNDRNHYPGKPLLLYLLTIFLFFSYFF